MRDSLSQPFGGIRVARPPEVRITGMGFVLFLLLLCITPSFFAPVELAIGNHGFRYGLHRGVTLWRGGVYAPPRGVQVGRVWVPGRHYRASTRVTIAGKRWFYEFAIW